MVEGKWEIHQKPSADVPVSVSGLETWNVDPEEDRANLRQVSDNVSDESEGRLAGCKWKYEVAASLNGLLIA